MSEVKDKCNMKNGFIVPSKGNSGGLALLWKEEIMVDVKTYSHDHIDAWVNGGLTVGWWHLTRFYGNPETAKCPESWAKLKHLKGTSSLPLLVIGDFNKIMGLSKKEGGSIRLRRQMEQVVDTINMCGLRDVGFIGPKFTWIYQQADGTQIWERLDRALATPEWMDLFPVAKLHHLSSLALDHSPLSLHFAHRRMKKKTMRTFRFESMWLKDSKCKDVVKTAWESGLMSATDWVLRSYLDRCKADFSAWNTVEFRYRGRSIVELQSKLEWLELQPSTLELIKAMKHTKVELNCWLDKEDEMWHQRS